MRVVAVTVGSCIAMLVVVIKWHLDPYDGGKVPMESAKVMLAVMGKAQKYDPIQQATVRDVDAQKEASKHMPYVIQALIIFAVQVVLMLVKIVCLVCTKRIRRVLLTMFAFADGVAIYFLANPKVQSATIIFAMDARQFIAIWAVEALVYLGEVFILTRNARAADTEAEELWELVKPADGSEQLSQEEFKRAVEIVRSRYGQHVGEVEKDKKEEKKKKKKIQ
jgi:hypothetical protein